MRNDISWLCASQLSCLTCGASRRVIHFIFDFLISHLFMMFITCLTVGRCWWQKNALAVACESQVAIWLKTISANEAHSSSRDKYNTEIRSSHVRCWCWIWVSIAFCKNRIIGKYCISLKFYLWAVLCFICKVILTNKNKSLAIKLMIDETYCWRILILLSWKSEFCIFFVFWSNPNSLRSFFLSF